MFKKIIILVLFLVPFGVNATTYETKDFSIDIDDNEWIVITRDNVDNNNQIKDLGLSPSDTKQMMERNNIYLDAIKSENNDNYSELRLIVSQIEGNTNLKHLHEAEDDVVSGYGDGIKEGAGISTYDVITTSDGYKYIFVEYSINGNWFESYFTIINYDSYSISVKKNKEFTLEEKENFRFIVDSIKYDNVRPNEDIKPLNPFVTGAIVIACLAALGAILGRNVKQNKKKNK